MRNPQLSQNFFKNDAVSVAKGLIGKIIARKMNGVVMRFLIIETEAYDGEKDLACHASKGRTKRTEVMYGDAGVWYVYLVYGMHWMINIVTSERDYPAAVLIRGFRECKTGKVISGPGRVSKALGIDGSFTGKSASRTNGLWFEQGEKINVKKIVTTPRIGIDYAGPIWKAKPWRFVLEE